MTKRKSKTTLAEKISVHVEGEEPFDRFNNLMQQLVTKHRASKLARLPKRKKEKTQRQQRLNFGEEV